MRFLSFTRKPAVVFQAAGLTRTVQVTDDGFMTIAVRSLAWRAMSDDRKDDRSDRVTFPLVAIRGGWFRPARWWRPGVLVLNVPNAGDPWRRRSARQRAKGVLPKQRVHKLRFVPRQQPAFEQCAREIGLAEPQEEAAR